VQVVSFAPIVADAPKVLILGSMPGRLSLQMQQYYAHPRNSFWPIMSELFGIDPELPYETRLTRLTAQRVALWDSLLACFRPGSLDSAIDERSIVANDFPGFFMQYPSIAAVFFNGAKSEQVFRRHVLPQLAPEHGNISYQRLPSTSPAHAALNAQQKLAQWQAVKQAVNGI
jgi:hypoxanthine-DNA glycosylase